MNLQAIHYVMLVCASLAAGLPNLEAAMPPAAAPYLKGAAAIFVLLAAVLGAVSPSAGGPKLPKSGGGDGATGTGKDPVAAAADKLTPPAAHRGFLQAAAVGLVSAIAVVIAIACTPAQVSTVDTVLNVVAADVQAGDAPPQIDSDVCKALGGSATTDAICANVTLLVEDALQLLLDGGKITSAQAATYLAAHPKTTAPVVSK
jgi:hypothetical protein